MINFTFSANNLLSDNKSSTGQITSLIRMQLISICRRICWQTVSMPLTCCLLSKHPLYSRRYACTHIFIIIYIRICIASLHSECLGARLQFGISSTYVILLSLKCYRRRIVIFLSYCSFSRKPCPSSFRKCKHFFKCYPSIEVVYRFRVP